MSLSIRRMRRLRVLWVSHFVPYPPKGGAFQRSYNLIRGAGTVHDLHLLALRHKVGTHPEEETRRAADELGRFCGSVTILDGVKTTDRLGLIGRGLKLAIGVPLTASVSETSEMHATIRDRIKANCFDLVHFDTIGLSCYRDDIGSVPCVLSHHGAESLMMVRRTERERNWLRRMIFRLEGTVLRRYEKRQCPRFSSNFVVSELDRQLLSGVAGQARFVVVPNGVDTSYFYPMPPISGRRLIFAGRLDQYSNRDAILHFVRAVWPGISTRFPDATLDIIGSNPPASLMELSRKQPGIRVHGFVPDVRSFFEQAAVAICPIRDGGGTRVKILDNMAMAKPIVSTSIGIEGIEVVPERDVLIADRPEEFVEQISRLFLDDSLRSRLGSSARRLAEERYSWGRIVDTMLEEYDRVAAHRCK